MYNPRVTKKERALIKGALRRVFSRSELRIAVVNRSIDLTITVPNRPKVKTWCRCESCNEPTPKSYIVVDHIVPVVLVHEAADSLSPNELIDRIWCDIKNLQAICEDCHSKKTKAENKLRRDFKRANLKEKEGNNHECRKRERSKKASKKRSTRNSTRTIKKRGV